MKTPSPFLRLMKYKIMHYLVQAQTFLKISLLPYTLCVVLHSEANYSQKAEHAICRKSRV